MKILIATDTYYPNVNGAAYFTYRLAQMLAKRGHHVFVIAPSQTLKDTIHIDDAGVTVCGVRSISVPIYPNFRISPLTISKKSIKKLVRQICPDVIHIQNHFLIGKGVLEVAKELNIPIMGTNHFMPENLVHYLHLPKFLERKLKVLVWRQFIYVYEQLDLVTAPTKIAAKQLEDLGLKKKVLPLSCGIDLQRFNPRNNGAYLKKKYSIPDRKILLYVGRLDKEKRIEIILRAMPIILQKSDVQLVLAGIGKLQTHIEHIVDIFGIQDHVTLTGFIPDNDLPNLYTIADVFVIAGIAELQGIVTMEAMASGLPVVAVNAMALPELVHDGENGYLFPNGNSQILAERVIQILTNQRLRDQMAQKSIEIIQAHDIHRIIAEYESVYQQIIAQHIHV